MKYVTDTAAGSKISAYIILNKKGAHIATVRAYHGQTVTVNVHDNKAGFQIGRAGGGGYDRLTAAMVGLTIDGHVLNDHCSQNTKTERLLKRYLKASPEEFKSQIHWNAKAERIGASFANYSSETKRFTSLHLVDGLNRLKKFGYKVIQAI